jgi:limonene-1,2-epoxide hydrolase
MIDRQVLGRRGGASGSTSSAFQLGSKIEVSEQEAMGRRNLLLGAVLAAPALLSGRMSRAAERGIPLSAQEAANLEIIAAFIHHWTEEPPDAEKLVSFMADDCVVHLEPDKPIDASNKAEALRYYKTLVRKNVRYDLRVLESFARGPVVAHYRIDHALTDSKPGRGLKLVAIFYMKDKRIQDWREYIIGPAV